MPEPTSTPAREVVLLPSDRFFVRTVPLAPGAAVAPQVELALESLSPFLVAQMYYGHVVSPAGNQALVYAAYRKRFSSEETAGWSESAAVLPAFLALLGNPPSTPTLRVWTASGGLAAAAWDGAGPLPAVVLAREAAGPADATAVAALVAEIRQRTGLDSAPVEEYAGAAEAAFDRARNALRLGLAGGRRTLALTLGRDGLRDADVRDKEFLAGRQAELRRDLMLWRSVQVCLGGLAALLLLELALFGGGFWLKGLKAQALLQAPAVKKIETAQSLSTRIAEMTERRLMPFEMLVLVNQQRPNSIQFVRATTTGLFALEIEAQTANAADVGQYEAALRASPQLAGVETRDLRSREGVTSFVLTVTFKPEALHPEAGT
ncbi:MAG: hypothetical protein JNG83_05115 [Opitutaceae bacterium]|nr:hypothetical protein [Opitutaceae bacterium]